MVAPCGLAWEVARNSSSIPEGCKKDVDQEYSYKLDLPLPLTVDDHEDTSDYLDNGKNKHPTDAG